MGRMLPYLAPLLILVSLAIAGAGAQTHTAGAPGIAPNCPLERLYPDFPNPDILKRVARGFNLPNWNAETASERPSITTLATLKSRGFSHIRLPVFHDSFTGDDLQSAEAQSYMRAIVDTVRTLVDLGYLVSIDLHPDGTFNATYRSAPEATLQRMIVIWEALSQSIAAFKPENVLVEVLNEPDTDAPTWQRHSAILLATIRRLLPHHTIVVGPFGPQRHESLFDITPAPDPNVIYAVHFYDPFIFTHQGASWLSPDDPIRDFQQLPFPMRFSDPTVQNAYRRLLSNGNERAAMKLKEALSEPWGFAEMDSVFDGLKNWSTKHARMIVVNEFGALSYHTPRISRLTWLKAVVERANARCIGWTHWDYSDGFGFVDAQSGSVDEAVLRMLVGATP